MCRKNRVRGSGGYLMEEMESRVLLSVAVSKPVLFNAAVKADRLEVRADLAQFRADCFSFDAKLLTDTTNIKKDDPAQATTVGPLLQTMKNDIHTMRTTLKEDRLTEGANALADESVIDQELVQLIKDKGNAQAVAADKAALLTDRIQLQTDLVAGLNSRIATRQAAYSTLIADGDAVVAAAETDPNASVKLTADLTKWTTDRSDGMTTLLTDLQSLVNARTQLVEDLTAMQGT